MMTLIFSKCTLTLPETMNTVNTPTYISSGPTFLVWRRIARSALFKNHRRHGIGFKFPGFSVCPRGRLKSGLAKYRGTMAVRD